MTIRVKADHPNSLMNSTTSSLRYFTTRPIRSSLAESHLTRHRFDYLSEKPGGECELYTTGFSDCKSDTKSVSF